MTKPTLYLCDDSKTLPFWEGANGWRDAEWSDFRVVRLDGGTAQTAEEFRAAIAADSDKGPTWYVVVDGKFGNDERGGFDLLMALREDGITNGVLYSDLVDGSDDTRLRQTGRFLALRRDDPAEKCRTIKAFLASGKAPTDVDVGLACESLSRVIHSLQNVFLPIELDSATLRDVGVSARAEIFAEHFGSGIKAYLSEASRMHDGGNIRHLLDKAYDSLPPQARDAVIKVKEELASALAAVPGTPEDDLEGKLQAVASKGRAFLEVLRIQRRILAEGVAK